MFKNKKNILKNLVSGFLLTIVFVFPLLIQAQNNPPVPGGITPPSDLIEIKNPFKQDSIQNLIQTLINEIFIPIGGVIAVLMVMYAGFLYVTARGDTGKMKKAKDALLWAVIGSAILLGAWVISEAIKATIDQLKI